MLTALYTGELQAVLSASIGPTVPPNCSSILDMCSASYRIRINVSHSVFLEQFRLQHFKLTQDLVSASPDMARWIPQLLTASSKDHRQEQGTEEPSLALRKVKGSFPRSAQQTSHMTLSLILDQP